MRASLPSGNRTAVIILQIFPEVNLLKADNACPVADIKHFHKAESFTDIFLSGGNTQYMLCPALSDFLLIHLL